MRAVMRCPRCATALVDVTPELVLPHVRALSCAGCHGHWLEPDSLAELETIVKVTWVELRRVPSHDEQARPMSCPRCSAAPTLEKRQSRRDDAVVMDVCGTCHGIWLDGGELAAIQEKGFAAATADALRFLLT